MACAWSSRNVVATPSNSSSSTAWSPTGPSIQLTYFGGGPIQSGSVPGGKGKQKERQVVNERSHTWTLPVPPLPGQLAADTGSSVTHLAFAPCGKYLLGVVRPTGAPEPIDQVVLYRNGACVNAWEVLLSDGVARLAGTTASIRRPRVAKIEWLDRAKHWKVAARRGDGQMDVEPHGAAPKPLQKSGSSSQPRDLTVALILESHDILFIEVSRLRVGPLSIKTTLLPLLVTPSPAPQLSASYPQLDPLGVGPASMGGSLGLEGMGFPGSSGSNSRMPKDQYVSSAAAGVVTHAQQGAGRLVLIVATNTRPCPVAASSNAALNHAPIYSSSYLMPPADTDAAIAALPTPPPPLPQLTGAGTSSMFDTSGMDDSMDFDFLNNDFLTAQGFDEAFGGPLQGSSAQHISPQPPAVVEVDKPAEEWPEIDGSGSRDTERTSRTVHLWEVQILCAEDAHKSSSFSARPLAPISLDDSLQDTHVLRSQPCQAVTLSFSPESEQDGLSLLVVAREDDERDGKQTPLRSILQRFLIAPAQTTLAEAFGNLECRKGDPAPGTADWDPQRAAVVVLEGAADLVAFNSSACVVSIASSSSTAHQTLAVLDPLALNASEDYHPPATTKFQAFSTSPSGLFAAATSHSGNSSRCNLVPVPLFPRGSKETAAKTLGAYLAAVVLQSSDASDVIRRVSSFGSADFTLACAKATYHCLGSMLKVGTNLSDTPLLYDYLGAAASLLRSSKTLANRGDLAFDALQVAACTTAFKIGGLRDRRDLVSAYRCENDAIWPLVTFASWFCEFWTNILADLMADDGGKPTLRWCLLLHPELRKNVRLCTTYVSAFRTFLFSMPGTSNPLLELAQITLADVSNPATIELDKVTKCLDRISTELPARTAHENAETLATLALSPDLQGAVSAARSILAQELPPSTLRPRSGKSTSPISLTDMIRKSALVPSRPLKECIACGNFSELSGSAAGLMQEIVNGRWRTFEQRWEEKCFCSGPWRTVEDPSLVARVRVKEVR